MEFRILGPLEVEARGQTLPLGGPKQRALMALLVTHANRVVSVDRLIEGLWGAAPPARASETIQVYVSQLRKQLEPDRKPGLPYQVLVSRRPGYLVRVGPDELDTYRFERQRDAAASALIEGDAHAAAKSSRQALALWRGPALAEFAAEPWAVGEAGRLNELRLQTLEQRVEADLGLARHVELISELEALVAENPLRERLCGQLMLALYRSGRQAEASEVFQRTRARLVEELGMEPGPELQRLLTLILNHDPGLSAPAPPPRSSSPLQGRLPTPLTRFIGREREIEEISGLLASSRLVSVLGIGGVGKTRLAIEVGTRFGSNYAEGVRYVDLAPLTNPDLLAQAVLNALGLRDQSGEDALLVIVNHLASRDLLVILDNCEHVAAAVAGLVETVLMLSPQIRVLATSRETLGVRGEVVYRLQGLAPESDSISLFLDRARSVSSSFDPRKEQLEAIQRVCERLDGIPLAIELAAARLTVLTPQEILRRLDSRLDLLTTGPRTVAERQRTLIGTIEWSYRLLGDDEQGLFRKLSVCRGWFGIDAALGVGAETGGSNNTTTDLVARLIDKSMLIPGVGDKLGRCRMLETVREYAAIQLELAGEAEETRRRHAEHYFAVVERAAPHLRAPDQRRWLDLLNDEYDNIRIALEWSVRADSERGLRTVAALENFWFRGRQTEGRFWVSRLLQATAGHEGRSRADALYVAAWLTWMQGDYDAAQQAAEELIAISTATGDEFNRNRGRRYIAALALSRGEHKLALPLFAEVIPDLRKSGAPWELVAVLNDYSFLLHDLGRVEEARDTIEEALARSTEAGDPWQTTMITDSAAMLAMLDGRVPEARDYWLRCVRIADEISDPWVMGFVLNGLARVALNERHAERSLCLLGAASRLRDSMGSKPIPMEQRIIDDANAQARALLDPSVADAAYDRGSQLSWEGIVNFALEEAV